MSWEDDYRNHEIWPNIRTVLEALTPVQEDQLTDQVLHLKALFAYADGFKENPLVVVPTVVLDITNSIVSQIRDHVPGNIPAIFTSGGGAPLSLSDKFAQQLRAWPAPGGVRLSGLGRRAEAVDESFQELIGLIAQRNTELEESLVAVKQEYQEALQTHRTEVEDAAAVATSAIQEKAAALGAELERIKSAASVAEVITEQQKARLDEALTSHQEKFSDAQEQRSEKWVELVASNQKLIDEHMVQMAVHQEQSRSVLAAVGVNATASDYAAYAAEQARIANKWRVGAVVAFSAAALYFLTAVSISYFGIAPDLEWWEVAVQKIGAPGGAAAVGYFLQREAGQHRQQEREARQVQLTLTALEPFIANLPTEEKRIIRMDTARELFTKQRGRGSQAIGDAESLPAK
ncbi:MAG: hypothetical protein ACOH14_09490 [Rhodoglobus sp.]